MAIPKLPRFLLDPLIRRRAKLHETCLDTYRVRIARTVAEHQDAFRLVRVGYVFQGIEDVGRSGDMRITAQHVLPESTVIVAYEKDQIVGTMTVTLDSPAGLPLDHDVPEEMARLRGNGGRLVEYGSLAVVRRCWNTGVTTLLNMAAHYLSLHLLKATHCTVGVHPKAAPFYRAVYCFRPFGEPRWHSELEAPMQPLVQSFDEAAAFFDRHHRAAMSTGLTPREHFCELLPPCIELPTLSSIEELARWKLPREVFRELFIYKSDRVETLDEKTREHLGGWRSIRTTSPPTREVTKEQREKGFR